MRLYLFAVLRPPEVPRAAERAPAATTFGRPLEPKGSKGLSSSQNLLPEQDETVIGGEEKRKKRFLNQFKSSSFYLLSVKS